ncbi:parallel beta helix pectate lyase-like protein [Lachnotalea glycerini]|jgi:pectate disaccharide-lyase|nr:right-handed parallel beta-helix repeat-containing protein [Lachnotalea glycerini]PXV96045.1 parallel beta helix pectate lyase-like protein [Lachnotalea glycerini]
MKRGRRRISFILTFLMIASLFCFNELPVKAATNYYVSTSGNDSNNGTSTSTAFKTITKAITKASAGTNIYVLNGTYKYSSTIKLSASGKSGSPIRILNYNGSKPVIDFSGQAENSSNRGFQISGSYWTISGLTIQNAGDNGIFISGNNNNVSYCTITKCHDTGLQMSNGAAYNTITSVTSTYNYDSATNGENADGFAAKLNIGAGNVFKNCIATSNSDDGYDCYRAGNAVKFYNCQANYNGLYDGNGQGFKVGGDYTADNHYLEGCTATGNKSRGFDQNNNTGAITLVKCTGIKNNVNFYFPTAPKSGKHSFTGCISTSGKSKDKIVGATTSGCSFNQ